MSESGGEGGFFKRLFGGKSEQNPQPESPLFLPLLSREEAQTLVSERKQLLQTQAISSLGDRSLDTTSRVSNIEGRLAQGGWRINPETKTLEKIPPTPPTPDASQVVVDAMARAHAEHAGRPDAAVNLNPATQALNREPTPPTPEGEAS